MELPVDTLIFSMLFEDFASGLLIERADHSLVKPSGF